jgi:hypothetical protein
MVSEIKNGCGSGLRQSRFQPACAGQSTPPGRLADT